MTTVNFTTKAGLDATIMLNSMSSSWYCGYVRVPKAHPLYGVSYLQSLPMSLLPALEAIKKGPVGKRVSDLRVDILFDVHGGLTFSDFGHTDGFLSEGWWLGFDCAHSGDSLAVQDEAYAREECESLARQIKQFWEGTQNG